MPSASVSQYSTFKKLDIFYFGKRKTENCIRLQKSFLQAGLCKGNPEVAKKLMFRFLSLCPHGQVSELLQ